jgi:xanthine dehydrogenase/oxidase
MEERNLGNDVSGIVIGASVTINSLRNFIKTLEKKFLDSGKSYLLRGIVAIRQMLSWFASNQIRNVASIGGNIVTASPISDLNPLLIACGAILQINSFSRGIRFISVKDFFISYRKVDLQLDEILQSIFIPYTSEFEFVFPFKQARRREDDISIVTSGMRFKLSQSFNKEYWLIESCLIVYGGMAPTAINAIKTENCLNGCILVVDNFEKSFDSLKEELSLDPETVPGGQAEYRLALAVSFLFKSFFSIVNSLQIYLHELQSNSYPPVPNVGHPIISNFLIDDKESSTSVQHFQESSSSIEGSNAVIVGKSIQHENADSQVCGEAQYTDDIPLPLNSLHGCLVKSSRAHARIVSIDTNLAEKCEGFVAFYGAKDITGSNHIGAVIKDEEVFAESIVKYVGAVSIVVFS